MAKEKLFLMPGCAIGKSGLPGKKLECKTGATPLEITEKNQAVIGKSLDFLISQGKIKKQSDIVVKKTADVKAKAETEVKPDVKAKAETKKASK